MITLFCRCFRPFQSEIFANYFLKRSKMSFFQNMAENTKLVWVDLEMTGLDVEKDKILEMVCLITDINLNVIAEGPDIIINQPDSVLESMDKWCVEQHGKTNKMDYLNVATSTATSSVVEINRKSGLTQGVRESKITIETAEEMFLEFVKLHTTPKKCLLAGNSVHVDKAFLVKYMPTFMNHLHYRIIDVSTVKELCKYWYPKVFKKGPRKAGNHRALDDIKESLEELKFYRASIFK